MKTLRGMNEPPEQEPTGPFENGVAFVGDGVEVMGRVVLENAALQPVIWFEGGADGVWRGRRWKYRAVDDDREQGVGDVGCRCGEVVGFC